LGRRKVARCVGSARGGGAFAGRAGDYVAVRFVLLVALGVTLDLLHLSRLFSIAAAFLPVIAVVDILMSNTSVAFISRFPAHPIRTVVFTTVAWITLAVAFADLYVSMPEGFTPVTHLSFVQALYFSVVTLATVGYGDIHPAVDATFLQLLVIVEIVTGLYCLVVLFAVVTSWANAQPIDRPLVRLAELQSSLPSSA
jgi:hypothetical protein